MVLGRVGYKGTALAVLTERITRVLGVDIGPGALTALRTEAWRALRREGRAKARAPIWQPSAPLRPRTIAPQLRDRPA